MIPGRAASSAPASPTAPLGLRLLDDRGKPIAEPVKVCLYRRLETSCLERSPYEVPSSMYFESLTAEGPAHGPINVNRSDLAHAGPSDLSVRIARKGFLTIEGLPGRAGRPVSLFRR